MAQKAVSVDSDVFPNDITATQRVLSRISGSFPQYSKVLDTVPISIHRRNLNGEPDSGDYNVGPRTIDINNADVASYKPDTFAFTILHEVQHARNADARDSQSDREIASSPFAFNEPNFAATRMTGNLDPQRLQQIKDAATAIGFPSSSGGISTEELMATLVPGMDNSYSGAGLKSDETEKVEQLHAMYPNTVNALYFADRNPEVQAGAHYMGPRTGFAGALLDSVFGQRTLDPASMQPPSDNTVTDPTLTIPAQSSPNPILEQAGK